ncbi:protein-arginine deiminase type-3 [Fusarium austroafricanum]|uniref:Protein-arginine deiminase type-3 n=1 Tax=Fusarium austroafricanum TaxID=2364996 RepID=A0A8H4P5B1_9HYPO|nr:protein-arginine deiminase type-3 [Fusarium austroafricanum]
MRYYHLITLCGLSLASALNENPQIKADIRADTNRDGKVDLKGLSDATGKTKWTETSGAIFLPNIGDTDRRCSKKALSGPALSNEKLDDCNDASDNTQRGPQYLAPLKTVPIPAASKNAKGAITVPDATQRKFVRIFRKQGKDWVYVDRKHIFSQKELQAGLELGIDARDTRRPKIWDGRVTVQFDVTDGDAKSSDKVMLRVAPVLTHHHLQKVEQVLAVQGNKTDSPYLVGFNKDFGSVVKAAGIKKDLYLFNASDDIWAQDFVEPGYASMPGPKGAVSIRIMIRSPQDERVAGRQLFEYYRKAGVGAVQHLGGKRDEINSGGNIEAIPPYTYKGKSWPAGRVILGDHGKQKHHISAYLEAQESQNPLHLDTAWLAIGHVDEFIQFLPAKNKRGWVAVINDPRAAIKLLEETRKAGHGSLPAISRKNDTSPNPGQDCDTFACAIPVNTPTITQLLTDKKLMKLNERCAQRIDGNIRTLTKEVGLTDEDIIRIPALFKASDFAGGDDSRLQVGAFFPGVVNNLVLTGYKTCVAPNPWGPVVDGKDIIAETIKAKYAKIGTKISFIDDWNTHHNGGGEVHCGSNSIRDMSARWCIAAILIKPSTQVVKKPTRQLFDKSIIKDKAFSTITLASFFIWLGFLVPYILTPSFCLMGLDHPVSSDLAYYMLPVLNAAQAVGRILSAAIVDHKVLGAESILFSHLVISGILALCWIAVHNLGGFTVFLILYGFFSGAVTTLPAFIIPYLCPSMAVIGTRIGIVYGAAGFGALIGAPIAIAADEAYGGQKNRAFLGAQLWCGLAILFSSFLSVYPLWEARKRRKAIEAAGSKFAKHRQPHVSAAMDPLSIIASIAGIATAGTSLSKAIYHFISSTRGASREMVEIARSISDLSCILSELRRVLRESGELCSRRLLRRIKSAMKRISRIHDDIYKLMDNITSFQTLKWSFKRSEVQCKLTLIESHKTAIQLMLNILILAVATRKEVKSSNTEADSSDEQQKGKGKESELPLLRQQSENLIYGACHCLEDLSSNQESDINTCPGENGDDIDAGQNESNTQIQLWRPESGPDDTGQWLFDLVFNIDAQPDQSSDSQSPSNSREAVHPSFKSEALAIRTPTELRVVICKPGAGDSIIDELLIDWTKLSRYEIERTKPVPQQDETKDPESPPEEAQVLHFNDSSGRRYRFPFQLVNTWQR